MAALGAAIWAPLAISVGGPVVPRKSTTATVMATSAAATAPTTTGRPRVGAGTSGRGGIRQMRGKSAGGCSSGVKGAAVVESSRDVDCDGSTTGTAWALRRAGGGGDKSARDVAIAVAEMVVGSSLAWVAKSRSWRSMRRSLEVIRSTHVGVCEAASRSRWWYSIRPNACTSSSVGEDG